MYHHFPLSEIIHSHTWVFVERQTKQHPHYGLPLRQFDVFCCPECGQYKEIELKDS